MCACENIYTCSRSNGKGTVAKDKEFAAINLSLS